MVKNKKHNALGTLLIGMMLVTSGCTSKDSSRSTGVSSETENILDSTSAIVLKNDSSKDFLSSSNVSAHGSHSGIDVSVNPYYDKGYEQGHEDGYNDGLDNLRGDSYDDDCSYRGKKRKEYELGYEEGYDAGFDDGFSDSDFGSEEEE